AVRHVARLSLERQGYHVVQADTPSAALKLVADETTAFDLVVTDVVMPGMTGRELVDAIRRRRPDVIALYVTGYADRVLTRDGILAPDVPGLVKPFTRAELVRKVRGLLNTP